MQNALFSLACPENEPVLGYAPGTTERAALQKALSAMTSSQSEIPLVIGGRHVKTGKLGNCIEPHNHAHKLAVYHQAGRPEIEQAIKAALDARPAWEATPHMERASIFMKAAELLSRKYRFKMNAATMLNQSKNAFQAEIDSACELADFWRYNSFYMQGIYRIQPERSPEDSLNRMEYRALEGFVFAVTPFNFTSIGGNLPTAPAVMGNTVVWKPSRNAICSSYVIMEILEEAGLPPGVINFVPGPAGDLADAVFASPHFAGIHFTGSTAVFHDIWKRIGNNIASYRAYPRIVGETGGKDFVVAHESADVPALVTALVRGAFEYQGQKCSAVSRAYVPEKLWPAVRTGLADTLKTVKMGPVQDFSNFMNAVIDRASFDNCRGYIERARDSREAKILCGGGCDDKVGYFVEPTVIVAQNPRYESMVEEIFGPILTVHVYRDNAFNEALDLCDSTSIYGLTGAIFAQDRRAVQAAFDRLRHAAGNFYINDKPTGAVVGQQPFGGARGSGTDDKAGSPLNLVRWTSPRAIKENFNPPTDYRYPFMA